MVLVGASARTVLTLQECPSCSTHRMEHSDKMKSIGKWPVRLLVLDGGSVISLSQETDSCFQVVVECVIMGETWGDSLSGLRTKLVRKTLPSARNRCEPFCPPGPSVFETRKPRRVQFQARVWMQVSRWEHPAWCKHTREDGYGHTARVRRNGDRKLRHGSREWVLKNSTFLTPRSTQPTSVRTTDKRHNQKAPRHLF